MFLFLFIVLIALTVLSYSLFAVSHEQYSDFPKVKKRNEYIKCFIPGYYLWFLLQLKLAELSVEED